MIYLFIQLLTLNLFFQSLIIPSFTVSDKNPQQELAEKRWKSLYSKINAQENQIQWLTTTACNQEKLITELKKSKKNTQEDNSIIAIEREISSVISQKNNPAKDKQLELITKQVKLQSTLLELLGYKKEKKSEETIQEHSSNTSDQLNFLKKTIEKHAQDIDEIKQKSNAPVCKVLTLEKEIENLRKEALEPSKQNLYSQIHLLDEQAKLQAQLLLLLAFYS